MQGRETIYLISLGSKQLYDGKKVIPLFRKMKRSQLKKTDMKLSYHPF